MKPLRTEFDMTRDDLAAATDVAADHDPAIRAYRRRAQRVIAGAVVLVLALQAATAALVWPRVNPPGLAMLGALALWLVWLCPTRRSVRRVVRKQLGVRLATPAGRASLGPRSVEVGREGLAISTDYGSALMTWRAVLDLIETPAYLIVILPGPTYLPVPRRAFGSDAEFERFCDAVEDLAESGGGLTGRAPPPGQFASRPPQ